MALPGIRAKRAAKFNLEIVINPVGLMEIEN